jgi:hypothetical protein
MGGSLRNDLAQGCLHDVELTLSIFGALRTDDERPRVL